MPHAELEAIFARYREARDIRWVQEEPANMGAWRSTRHRIEAILPEGAVLSVVARKASPTPATGYYPMHVDQERVLLERALADLGGVQTARPRVSAPAGAREGGES